MKRMIACLLTLILILPCLSGCRNTRDDAEENEAVQTGESQTEIETKEEIDEVSESNNKVQDIEETSSTSPLEKNAEDELVITIPADEEIGGD